jgi:hypothetical protein
MTEVEAEQKKKELINLLKPKYKDISAHVDLVTGTDKINISLFWNRKSRDHYDDSRTFRIISTDYDRILNEEIMKLL